jgi:AbrB family looped-hinge helix DNA binding protein
MTTRLSTKGQLIIPRAIRSRQGWRAGTEILLEDRGDHVVLRAVAAPPPTRLEDLVGCTGYRGRRRSLREMEAGIAKGARAAR